jgi:hypothetical protein
MPQRPPRSHNRQAGADPAEDAIFSARRISQLRWPVLNLRPLCVEQPVIGNGQVGNQSSGWRRGETRLSPGPRESAPGRQPYLVDQQIIRRIPAKLASSLHAASGPHVRPVPGNSSPRLSGSCKSAGSDQSHPPELRSSLAPEWAFCAPLALGSRQRSRAKYSAGTLR